MKEKNAPQGFCVNGITIAPGVVETIVSLAAAEVPGVAGVGTAGPISAIAAALNAGRSVPTAGIRLSVSEDNTVAVSITVQAYYGYRLADVAAQVRSAVADALKGQIGAQASSVDVYVDALAFEEN
ncbi:MAG: Asp23/Gls24 family envelope stress response protein [Coriobacteriales bacterium]